MCGGWTIPLITGSDNGWHQSYHKYVLTSITHYLPFILFHCASQSHCFFPGTPRGEASVWCWDVTFKHGFCRTQDTGSTDRGREQRTSFATLRACFEHFAEPSENLFLPLVNLTTPTVPHISFFLAHGTMISPLYFFLSAPSAPPQNISSPCKSGFF